MINEQKRLDTITNNLANSNTTGFKKEGMVAQSFDERLAIKIKDTSALANRPEGIGYISLGTKVGETYTNWEQGGFQITDKPSDLAVAGSGFFAVAYTNKAGETSVMYTRDGAFTVDTDGYIRTSNGDYLLNSEGALTGQYGEDYYVQIDPALEYAVAQDGTITQNGEEVDTIGLVDVADYDYINKYGENLYSLIDGGEIIEAEKTDKKRKKQIEKIRHGEYKKIKKGDVLVDLRGESDPGQIGSEINSEINEDGEKSVSNSKNNKSNNDSKDNNDKSESNKKNNISNDKDNESESESKKKEDGTNSDEESKSKSNKKDGSSKDENEDEENENEDENDDDKKSKKDEDDINEEIKDDKES